MTTPSPFPERTPPVASGFLRAIIDSAIDYGILSLDAEGRVTFWSKGAERVLGWTAEEICGRPAALIFTEEDCAAGVPAREMQAALTDGRAYDERWHRKKDGTCFWASGEMMPLVDAGGEPSGFVKILRDRTAERVRDKEARRTAEALRESEARLQVAIEAGRLAVWEFDMATGSVTPSPALNRLMGFPADRLVSADEYRAGYLPGVQDYLSGVAREALERGESFFEAEFRYRRPDGEIRWLLMRANFRYGTGGVNGIIGVIIDVTDRKTAEEALAESEDHYRHATELNPQVSWTATPDGQLDRVARRWFDWTGGSGLGDSWGIAIHPDDLQPSVDAWSRATATGEPYDIEHRVRLRSGEYHWMHSRAYPRRRPDGSIVKWYGSTEDIHDRKRAEADLLHLNATLEHRVAEAISEREQAEEALRQSQKMEAVGQLTGGIAHDFNNLLQGIVGSLDLVQKRISQGRVNEVDRFVTGAMTSANRAAALTHRLLAFSRRQPLDPKPVKANALVASMEDLLRRTMGEQIDLELVLAGGLWLTRCDPNQLENAILNLSINARDAMPAGGKLTIETCNAHLDNAYAARIRDVIPGQYVCICVTDTGSGMSAEVIARAFDPFFTTKPIGEGTGLGLSMIYGFTRQSEGYAKIYSEAGKGTTVKLYLPRFRGEAEVDTEPQGLSDDHHAEAGEVVVVIEDEAVVRGLIVEVLSELGYRALEAADGPSGLKLLDAADRVDLLVTDIGLPGLNGRQVADAARVKRPELKVLFMTGYAENAALAAGFLEPGMEMLTKPVAMETLATRIRQIIERP